MTSELVQKAPNVEIDKGEYENLWQPCAAAMRMGCEARSHGEPGTGPLCRTIQTSGTASNAVESRSGTRKRQTQGAVREDLDELQGGLEEPGDEVNLVQKSKNRRERSRTRSSTPRRRRRSRGKIAQGAQEDIGNGNLSDLAQRLHGEHCHHGEGMRMAGKTGRLAQARGQA